jgi:predicted nucleotidyltransferase
MNILAEILSSKVRAEIFRLLFGMNDTGLHMREIARRSGFAIGTIQTELRKLLRLDLVYSKRDGNRTYYEANKAHPLFADIRRLVLKTVGLGDVLRGALHKSPAIRCAFVFGSIARGEEKAGSDIDLMVIGDTGFRKVVGLLEGASEQIGREINPHVFTPGELKKRIAAKDHFVSAVMGDARLFIKGGEDDLDEVA